MIRHDLCMYCTDYQYRFLKSFKFYIVIKTIFYFCITADMGRFDVSGFPWDDCYWTCSDAGIRKCIGVGEIQIPIQLQKSDRTSSQDKCIPSKKTKYRILKQFCQFRNSNWLKDFSYKKYFTQIDLWNKINYIIDINITAIRV